MGTALCVCNVQRVTNGGTQTEERTQVVNSDV